MVSPLKPPRGVMSDMMKSFWAAIDFSLDELNLSLNEIQDQAKTGEFESPRVEALWKIIEMAQPREHQQPANATLRTVPVTTGTGEPATL